MAQKTEIVPFGKYRGQPIDVLQQDRGYCEWLMGQDWLHSRYPNLRTIIINNFQEPEETPEHNALQAKFLDGRFRVALAKLILRDRLPETHLDALAEAIPVTFEDSGADVVIGDKCDWCVDCAVVHREMDAVLFKQNVELINEECLDTVHRMKRDIPESWGLPPVWGKTDAEREELENKRAALRAELEEEIARYRDGVQRRLDSEWIYGARVERLPCIGVEIKPSMGDDFPAVIRQIRAMRVNSWDKRALVLGHYTGSGATLEQVRAMFESSDIFLVLISEIDELSATL